MIKTDADYKPSCMNKQCVNWFCLDEVQDELVKLVKNKTGKSNMII